jgi:hypothetical protein
MYMLGPMTAADLHWDKAAVTFSTRISCGTVERRHLVSFTQTTLKAFSERKESNQTCPAISGMKLFDTQGYFDGLWAEVLKEKNRN